MLTKTQENVICEIYQDYQEDIKPLVYYIERKFHKFPLSLLNEIRDVFDHISRCYIPDAKPEYINTNLSQAKNHFTRVKLDAYKYVNDSKRRDFTKWKWKYNKYDLQSINDGEFWAAILNLEDEAESLFSRAKDEETKNVEQSYHLFYESAEKYNKINDLIREKRNYIAKAKFKYRRETIINQAVGFVIGVIGSIIANNIDVLDFINSFFSTSPK